MTDPERLAIIQDKGSNGRSLIMSPCGKQIHIFNLEDNLKLEMTIECQNDVRKALYVGNDNIMVF